MVSQVNMALLIFGLVLYLAGPQMAKVTWLPIFFLVFAVPIPGTIYLRIAGPLQELAARGSGLALRIFDVEKVVVTGSHIRFTTVSGEPEALTVAEACAGMRLLMAFLALGVVMAYVAERALWQRIVLVAAAIPIAVLCNVIRVTITSTMFVWDRPELGQGFMHKFAGMVMLIPALVMLWLLGLLLQSLFVEVGDDEKDNESGDGKEAAREAEA
ncbi:MAG: exosortase/archaeosortase family protein, partial [Planctomycetota bacterium]|jgi:exosortase